MKVEKDKMNVLGEKYATVVLVEALRSEEDLKLSDLLSLITNYRTVELLCNKLVQNDLVELYNDGERYTSKRIKLTEKGKKISAKLVECVEML